LRREVASLSAVELMVEDGLALACRSAGLAPPFAAAHPAVLLVEASAARDPLDELSAAVASLEGVADVAVATEPSRAAALWRYREAHTEAVNALGAPHKLDVALPAGALAAFVARVPGVVAAADPHARTWLWGHVGDGNVHVNVTGVAPDDDRVDDAVLRAVVAEGGSISAEHGIGTAKRRWLGLVRSPAELDAFRALKAALDPDGVLNPHVLLPPA
ncbi:MAG: FAD-binding oxidoreductase, partial [Acidimicrobiales bacterium]